MMRSIYYAQRFSDGAIKIGITKNVDSRLMQHELRHGKMVLLATHEGDEVTEASLHHRFWPFLLEGREWFSAAPEVLEYIESLSWAAPDLPQRVATPAVPSPAWATEDPTEFRFGRYGPGLNHAIGSTGEPLCNQIKGRRKAGPLVIDDIPFAAEIDRDDEFVFYNPVGASTWGVCSRCAERWLKIVSSPEEIRTPATALRGRRPRPLDDGAE